MRKPTKAGGERTARSRKGGAAAGGSVPTTVRFPKPLKRALQTLAKKDNRTFSNYMFAVLTNHAREAGELPSEG